MNVQEMIIGVFSSLIATVIWVLLSQFYDVNSRRNIAILLDLLYDSADSFDTAIVTGNVDIAEIQSDKIIEYSIKIIENIKPFTYFGKKSKLVYTVLYNVYYTMTYYKRLYIGYDGKAEQEAKLRKFERKYYYKVTINKGNIIDERSMLLFSIMLLSKLNNTFSIKSALTSNYFVDIDDIDKEKMYIELISMQNFKSDSFGKYDLRKKVFSYKEYKTFINKKLKFEKGV